MNRFFVRVLRSLSIYAGTVALTMSVANAQKMGADAQISNPHVVKARAAAYMPGHDLSDTFDSMCTPIKPDATQISGAPASVPGPSRSKERWGWAADPVKVFDNLYYVGNSNLNNQAAWALKTSDG